MIDVKVMVLVIDVDHHDQEESIILSSDEQDTIVDSSFIQFYFNLLECLWCTCKQFTFFSDSQGFF